MSLSKPQTSFLSDATIAVLSSVLARVVALCAMSAITRLYSSQDYGTWVLVLALAGMFVPLTTLRYDIAMVLAHSHSLLRRLIWLMLAASLTTFLLLLAVHLLLPRAIQLELSGFEEGQALWLAVVPVLVLFLGLQVVFQTWLTREKRFVAVNLGSLLQVLVSAAVMVTFGLLGSPSAKLAVIGGFSGQVAVVFFFAALLNKSLSRLMRPIPSIRSILRAAYIFRVYPKYMLPFSFSVAGAERLTQVAISSLFSVGFLATFFVARQIIFAPAQILSASLRNVLFSHGARHESMDETRPYIEEMVEAFSRYSAPILVFCLLWVKPIVELVLGTRWPLLPEVAWWCVFPGLILVLTNSLDRVFDLAGKQKMAMGLQIASDALMIVVLLSSWMLAASGIFMIASLAVAQACHNIIWLTVLLRISGISWIFIQKCFSTFILLLIPSLFLQELIFLYIDNATYIRFIISTSVLGMTIAALRYSVYFGRVSKSAASKDF